MKIYSVFFFCLVCSALTSAQSYTRIYDNTTMSQQSVLRSDGLPVVAFNSYYGSVIKGLDNDGNVLWSNSYTDAGSAVALFIHPDNSITYFTSGFTYAVSMHQMTETGEETAVYNFTADDLGIEYTDSLANTMVVENPDGSYGITLGNGFCTGVQINVLVISSDGSIISSSPFCTDINYGHKNIALFEKAGNYLLAGYGADYWTGYPPVQFFYTVNADGDILAEHEYTERVLTDGITKGDNYLFIGYYTTITGSYQGYVFMETDFDGNIISENLVPSADHIYPLAISETSDGGYLILFSYSYWEGSATFFMKTSSDFTIEWSGSEFNDPSVFNITGFTPFSDDEYLLTGRTNIEPYYFTMEGVAIRCGHDGVDAIDHVLGTIYYDENDNGVQDAGESGVPGQLLNSSYSGLAAMTDPYYYSGGYELYEFSADPFTIELFPTEGLYQSAPPGPINIFPDFADGPLYTIADQDFGERFITEGPDMAVAVSTWGIAPGFISYFSIDFSNNGSENSTGGIVTITHPESLTFYDFWDEITAFDITDTSFSFDTDPLAVFHSDDIWFHMSADLSFSVGDTLEITAVFNPVAGDLTPADNYDTIHVIAVESIDPNQKLGWVNGWNADGNIDVNSEWITYDVDFQNTGTGVTHFIVITDTLDANLIPTTFTMIGASHPYTIEFPQPNVIKWIFNDIALQPMDEDEAHSYGSLHFKIKLAEELPPNTTIANTANIYFDYNTAVITNTVESTLKLPDGISTIPDDLILSVYPNPSQGKTIAIAGNGLFEMFRINDIHGRQVGTGQVINNVIKLEAFHMVPGAYILTVTGSNGTGSCDLIVMK